MALLDEIELFQAQEGELATKDPDAHRWLLHNFDVIKRLLSQLSTPVPGPQGDPGPEGDPGPRGDDGPAGPNTTITLSMTAGATLGGHRVVKVNNVDKVVYADKDDVPLSPDRLFGVTLQSAVLDDLVDVTVYGIIDEVSWAWDVTKPLYLGANGLITQTPPTTGCVLCLGFPITPIQIMLAPKAAIVLV